MFHRPQVPEQSILSTMATPKHTISIVVGSNQVQKLDIIVDIIVDVISTQKLMASIHDQFWSTETNNNFQYIGRGVLRSLMKVKAVTMKTNGATTSHFIVL